MTDEELLILYAKDSVISFHGFAVRNFTKETWDAAVMGILKTFTDNALVEAKKVYL